MMLKTEYKILRPTSKKNKKWQPSVIANNYQAASFGYYS